VFKQQKLQENLQENPQENLQENLQERVKVSAQAKVKLINRRCRFEHNNYNSVKLELID